MGVIASYLVLAAAAALGLPAGRAIERRLHRNTSCA